MNAIRALSLFLGLTAACASSTSSEPAAGDIAPRLHTVEQLRDAYPLGSELRLRFEQPNTPAIVERWVFVTSTATVAVIESETFTEDGAALGPKQRTESTWDQLHAHGAFPAEKTTIEEVELEASIGTTKCRLYKVAATDDQGAPITRMYWFAHDFAGPPVRFETWKDGARVFRGEMLERKIPGKSG